MSTEEKILGEIVAQHLERRLGEPVERRFGYGGTLLTYENLQMGDIDLYPEYTSAILSTILRHAPEKDPSVLFERARSEVFRSSALQLLDSLGVDNGFVIITRAEFAKKHGLTKISDLEKIEDQWLLAVTPEFQQRIDGYQSLVTTYDLGRGSDLRIVDTSGLYMMLRDKKVDVIASHATDGMLATGEFQLLKDDRRAFGPAQACILVRQLAIDKNPNLRPALIELSGKLTNDVIRTLNYDVDVKGRSIHDAAAAFLNGSETGPRPAANAEASR
jgi:glycine betaine/choline ABC-type transport system substrate-binding protein